MLANGIKQTTATTGPGALTLATVAGMPALSGAFIFGQLFAYTLLDSADRFLEAGYGYLLDATTLVRARVLATYSGSYGNSTPTAVNLTGTTTVICAPHASSLESMPATVDSQSSSVGRWLTCAGRTMQQSPSAVTALRVYYLSFLLKMAAPVNSLMLCVSSGGAAGTVARAGLYASNEKGYIGQLIVSTGNLDTVATGNKSETFAPIMLPAGRYVAASVFSGAPTVTGHTSSLQQVLGGSPFGMNAASPPVGIDFRFQDVASAVLPAAPSLTTSANAIGAFHPPMVFVGVVS